MAWASMKFRPGTPYWCAIFSSSQRVQCCIRLPTLPLYVGIFCLPHFRFWVLDSRCRKNDGLSLEKFCQLVAVFSFNTS